MTSPPIARTAAGLLALFLASCAYQPEPTDSELVTVNEELLAGPLPYRGVNLSGAEFGGTLKPIIPLSMARLSFA